MLLTFSVSFGKNIQPFMFVTFIGDKGGSVPPLKQITRSIKWQRKEKKQLRKKLLLREEKLLLRKRKKQLKEEKDNNFFL